MTGRHDHIRFVINHQEMTYDEVYEELRRRSVLPRASDGDTLHARLCNLWPEPARLFAVCCSVNPALTGYEIKYVRGRGVTTNGSGGNGVC